MKSRIFTYVACECGHLGAIIETFNERKVDRRYRVWRRNLSNVGIYEGDDPLFAATKPACPECGRNLGPEHIVAQSELHGTDELLLPNDRLEREVSPSDQHPVCFTRSTASPNTGRSFVPTTLPKNAETSQSQPCRLPDTMPLKYAPILQPYARRAP
ncbi:hypothetical protein P3T43_001519 [Paraburkholderia sp. GAS41]|jgi:hypothetical protein